MDVVSVQDDASETAGSDDVSSAVRASAGSTFQFLPDGSRVFRVRVDVHDFTADELTVRTEGRQLVISARHSQADMSGGGGGGSGGIHRRQFIKTVDLPDDVQADRLVSRLAYDGVLTIEAPANPPSYQAVLRSRDGSASTTPSPPQTASPSRHHVVDLTQQSQSTTDDHQPGTRVINTG